MTKKTDIQTFNSNEAWDKLHSRLLEEGLIPERKAFLTRANLLKIAAFILVSISISALSIYYIQLRTASEFVVLETSAKQEIQVVNLEDGSVVYMNENSRLKYPKKFENGQRLIEFEGEAFFDIARMPSKPFIIKVNDSEVKVLGTSFNVNTHSELSEVEVIVATGKVQVSRKAQKVFIEPGFMASVNNSTVSKNKNQNLNYLSWKTKQFDFRNVEMHQVLEDLNKAYNVTIILKDKSLLNNKLRTKFDNDSLSFILKVISETYNLKIEKKDDFYILH